MKKDNVEARLENLKIKSVVPPEPQLLKLAIISSKRSVRLSLWLLGIPFLFLSGGLADSLFHILLPPWSVLKEYGSSWPEWIRIGFFMTVVIVIPLVAVVLNILAILFVHYDRAQKVLHIAIRFKKANMIILFIAGVVAMLFIGHSIADWIAGTN